MVVSTANDVELLHVFSHSAQDLREGSVNQLPPEFSEEDIGRVLSVTWKTFSALGDLQTPQTLTPWDR